MAKILIVDDSETIRKELRTALEPGGFDLFEASDGQQGYEFVKQDSNIDLVITDFNMPKMNGNEMCAKIKSDVSEFSGAIIMVTTEVDFELKSQGKKIGVKYWINKPFNPDSLLKVVTKIVNR